MCLGCQVAAVYKRQATSKWVVSVRQSVDMLDTVPGWRNVVNHRRLCVLLQPCLRQRKYIELMVPDGIMNKWKLVYCRADVYVSKV